MQGDEDPFEKRLAAHEGREAEQPPARRAAVACVLRFDPEPSVLLMRRVHHERDPWSGHVSLPGGRRELADADLFATALRETREEVGLELEHSADLLCRMDPVPARARGRRLDMDVTPFVFRWRGGAEPAPGPEAEALFWLPLTQAARGALDGQILWTRGGLVHRLPCWNYSDYVVWGMTLGMLRGLLTAGGLMDRGPA